MAASLQTVLAAQTITQYSNGRIIRSAQEQNTRARNFFEKLWQYDQVVFNASRQVGIGNE